MGVSQHLQKRFIGLNNLSLEIPDYDPNNVGVNQTPDLRLAFLEVTVKIGILQRYRCLRRQSLSVCYILENNLSPDVFTPTRIAALDLPAENGPPTEALPRITLS
jgi:hypothetical protein